MVPRKLVQEKIAEVERSLEYLETWHSALPSTQSCNAWKFLDVIPSKDGIQRAQWGTLNRAANLVLCALNAFAVSLLCIDFLRKAFGSRCLVLSAVRFVEKPLALEPTNCAAAHAFIVPGLKPCKITWFTEKRITDF